MNEVVAVAPRSASVFVPQQGAISLEAMEQSERQIATALSQMEDIAEIEDIRDKFSAIEQYTRKKQLHLPALGAQRRLEARIGQLLGPSSEGGRPTEQNPTHAEGIQRAGDKADFRVLARALNGEVQLSDDEWRQSRRQLVDLVKKRTPKEEKVEAAVAETNVDERVNNGGRIVTPEGETVESMARAGMAMEASGAFAAAVAEKLNINEQTYRRVRDVVSLADYDGLSKEDASLAAKAVQEMNATGHVIGPWSRTKPIAERVWGNEKMQGPRAVIVAKRLERFEHAFGIIMQDCVNASEIDLPYLSAERAEAAIKEIEEAHKNLRTLSRRIKEIHG